MNDNDIIKALGCCRVGKREHDCKKCPLYCRVPACMGHLTADALDLINRQKAEIEKYELVNTEKFNNWMRLEKRTKERYAELYEEAKSVVRAEAIKEFAERLKKNKYLSSDWSHGEHPYVVEETDIDNLVKEMTEEKG